MRDAKLLFSAWLAALLFAMPCSAVPALAGSAQVSPEARQQEEMACATACIRGCSLEEVRAVADPASFGEDVGYDALLMRGRTRAGVETRSLCLFDRRSLSASCVPAAPLFERARR